MSGTTSKLSQVFLLQIIVLLAQLVPQPQLVHLLVVRRLAHLLLRNQLLQCQAKETALKLSIKRVRKPLRFN